MRRLATTIGLSALVLIACASGPEIFSNKDPNVDFTAFRTYTYLQPLSTDGADGTRSLLSTMLITAVDREMQARGFSKSEDADLRVNFFLLTQERLNVQSAPLMTSTRQFHSYRGGRYQPWSGREVMVRQYTVGTLSIDLVDVTRNAMIWEGLAQARKSGVTPEITQERVDNAVRLIFEQFDLDRQ